MIPTPHKILYVMAMRTLAAILLLLLLIQPQRAHAATRYYVNVNAAPGGNGLSWGGALRHLNDALGPLGLASAGDEIWVAKGVYYPDVGTIAGDTDAVASTFRLKAGVAVYGGFAGNETALAQRNITANVTVLSGDITQNDTNKDANGVTTSIEDLKNNNAIHVVTADSGDIGSSARLDGFTISAGIAIADGKFCPEACGAGLLVNGGSPTLTNLSFIGNHAGFGGGYFSIGQSPNLTHVRFQNNAADHQGGGLYLYHGLQPTFTDLQFIDNAAAERGGGIYSDDSSPTLNQVTFEENTAGDGGAIYITEGSELKLTHTAFIGNRAFNGGGIFANKASLDLEDVTFRGNQARFNGGGIYVNGGATTLTNFSFLGNRAQYGSGGGLVNFESFMTLVNGVFAGNRAAGKPGSDSTGYGGAMLNSGAIVTLTNLTLSGNQALEGSAMYSASSSVTVQNTVIWNNPGVQLTTVGSSMTFRYSLIQGLGPSGEANLDGSNPANAPRFVREVSCGADQCTDDPDADDINEGGNDDYGDLRLKAGSPVIDIGDNYADLDGNDLGTKFISNIPNDRAGQPRFVAAKSPPATVDFGAYESAVTPPHANAGGPYHGVEGNSVAFNGSASTDDFGIKSYAWDCTNNGSIDATAAAPTGSKCTYANSGNYTLGLTVSDGAGATNKATAAVTIDNIAPVYQADANQSTFAGNAKSFVLGSFTDPSAEGSWAVTVDWGDDTELKFNVSSAGGLPNKVHTYAQAGTYNVVVTIHDDKDSSNDPGFQIVVNPPPNGAPAVTPPANQEAVAGVDKGFQLGSFTDNGSAGPWQISVDWHDSSSLTTFSASASGALVPQHHTYTVAGDYDVIVLVSDGAFTGSTTFRVAVAAPPNDPPLVTPPANQQATAGVDQSFTLGSFADSGSAGPWQISVDWRDGSQFTKFSANAGGALASKHHAYTAPGDYEVVVSVSDGAKEGSAKFHIVVAAAPNGAPGVTRPEDQLATAGVAQSFQLGSFTDSGSDGPWQITVNWDDGSPLTKLSASAGGEIAATGHTYAAAGDYEVVVSVNDGALPGSTSFHIVVTAPSQAGNITGLVFDDKNSNSKQDKGEAGVAHVEVTASSKAQAEAATVDVTSKTTTNASGIYRFDNLPAGDYSLKLTPATFQLTSSNLLSVKVSDGETTTAPPTSAKAKAPDVNGAAIFLPALTK